MKVQASLTRAFNKPAHRTGGSLPGVIPTGTAFVHEVLLSQEAQPVPTLGSGLPAGVQRVLLLPPPRPRPPMPLPVLSFVQLFLSLTTDHGGACVFVLMLILLC